MSTETTQNETVNTRQSGDNHDSNQVQSQTDIRDMVPAKFRNTETGDINWEDVLKSYLALEKKLSARLEPSKERPVSPDEYIITLPNELMKIDSDVNQRLFDLGCTNEQAQGIYNLAAEKIIPMLQNLSLDLQAARDLRDLESEFGGPEQFNTIARQISAWGEKNLDKAVFELLASHKDGIMALYRMMNGRREESVLPTTLDTQTQDNEETLRRLMQDPKYWKYQDPELTKRIETGFKRLYD